MAESSAGAVPVTPSPLTAPTTGLFASANRVDGPNRTVEGTTIPEWALGITYDREGCTELSGLTDPCDTLELEDPEPAIRVSWNPYEAWAGFVCATIGSPADAVLADMVAKAQRRLRASEQKQVEAELWGGTIAQANPTWDNKWLTDGTATDLGTGTALEVLACLTQYLGATAEGQRGMIHATPQVVTLWAETGAVYRSGALILTVATDDVVVAGRGYGGDGTSNLAFATDVIDLRLGPVDTSGGTLAEVQHVKNRAVVRAHRLALASWDGCRHGQMEISALPACEAVS